MNSFQYQNPTRIVFGRGSVDKLGELAKPFGTTILLVYGSGSIKQTGLYDKVMGQLNEIGANVLELPAVEPNPRLSTVKKGIEIARAGQADLILAVGGGSVIDAAKAVAVGVPYDGDVWDFCIRKAVIRDALPLATVLTLSATGSEMNGNSVISNWEERQKRSFGSPFAYPKFSILDPALTYSVPRNHTVYGSIDIMSHVFEQYFSLTEHTPLQERFCESILHTVIENVGGALTDPGNYEARANLMWAGTMQQDWASHGIEHEISAIYDIPHGAGLSIVFPNWMEYVHTERLDRFVQYAVRVWGIDPAGKSDQETALAGIEATRNFFTRIGAQARLADFGIGAEHLDRMADEAVRFGPIGSFKRLDRQDVRNILESCL
ncbi:iron-containing alcohol dehydrogenase [Paenibacillus hemerocallicola]|uniref:Iron-containing alcohol dehydrogenase n=1 Tax=Paenibacillus hemerocallicola TaxID=1172614 RepID=A0A5C4TIT5_9BACL|nr:iron-containing alcohol dehydrogenase [Paenibacillus hemerocallicola]TNJ68350.1 iron-containing alcohol dehydrogenase [Paenibacillus hemerocallicola]